MRARSWVGLFAAGLLAAGCVASSTGSQGLSKAGAADASTDMVTPPEKLLDADTVVALKHDRRASGLNHVGVWAASSLGCAEIDQDDYESFAVVTPDNIRLFEESCTYRETSRQGSQIDLAASCTGGDATTQRTITITMRGDKAMTLRTAPDMAGFSLLRCRLPR